VDTVLQQLINGLSLGAIYALIALGYTMVYGVLRLINFAHGDVYMLGAFAGYYLANALDLDASPSILGAIVVTLGAMAICSVIGALLGGATPAKSREALRSGLANVKDFPGVTGSITIDKDRNAVKPAVILRVQDGKFQYVETVAP